MALPLKSWFTVFNAITATETARIPTLGSEHPEHANSLILEIVGASTPSWTLDIQGRTSPNGTYTAVDYQQIWQAGAAGLSTSQLSITDTTRRFYVIRNCPPFLQLVATRTTGSLTVHGCYTSEPFIQELLTTARGSVYIEGPTASDVAEAGNPVQIGGSVDDTGPVSAGEGDVRRYRATPEGNMIVEIYRDNVTMIDSVNGLQVQGGLADNTAVGSLRPLVIGGLRDDVSPATGDEGNVKRIRVSSEGNLYTEILSANTKLTQTNGLRVQGAVDSDGVAAGSPVLLGGEVDDTSPAAAAEADVRTFRSTPEGNQIVELYRDNISLAVLDDAAFTVAANPVVPIAGLADDTAPDSVDEGDVGAVAMTLSRELYTRPMRRGAGEVIERRGTETDTTRSTLYSPTAGKKCRIISVQMYYDHATAVKAELYFGTGANITTTAGKEIAEALLDLTDSPNYVVVWPDGAGPVGAVDDVISIRIDNTLVGTVAYNIAFREE